MTSLSDNDRMTKLFLDLIGERQDEWVWRVVDEDGTAKKICARTFPYYLDCLADAKQNGYTQPPSFRTATPVLKNK